MHERGAAAGTIVSHRPIARLHSTPIHRVESRNRWSNLVPTQETGSGAVVAHQLWELAVGGSNPPSPTDLI